MKIGESWGHFPRARAQQIVPLSWRNAVLPKTLGRMLAYGNGRSYGDVCLNDGGALLHTRRLNRFLAFDAQSGILRVEAGMLLSEILDFIVPQGWFLPVSPGTRFVTIGGAIANDVHGKNHHRAGTFGEHVLRFELLRSDATRVECSARENGELYKATIGGLGLTGLIVWAEFALQRIASAQMEISTRRFNNIAQFFELSNAAERDYAYNVAWIDTTARHGTVGRGIFTAANHAPANSATLRPRRRAHGIPLVPPFSLVNDVSVRAFNALYFRRASDGFSNAHYEPYFYPLDAVTDWNRIYGRAGFLQYQCVVPPQYAAAAIGEMLQRIAASGKASFLAVLKTFGDRAPAGTLSFARAGTTLALDFPNRGAATFSLLDRLDDIVANAGGAVYPAKDARMSAAHFRQYFPHWRDMLPFIDPEFSSGFWRRVTEP